jgi:hypothetical protein
MGFTSLLRGVPHTELPSLAQSALLCVITFVLYVSAITAKLLCSSVVLLKH